MVPISPAGCDHVTMRDVEVTCAIMSESVDRTDVIKGNVLP